MENFTYKDILGYLKTYRSTPEEYKELKKETKKSRFIIYIDCGNKGENKNKDKEYLLEKSYGKMICFSIHLILSILLVWSVTILVSAVTQEKDNEWSVEKKVFFLTILFGS